MVVKIDSKLIKAVDYFGTTMIIQFVRGGMYKYYDIPQEEYDGFIDSDSKGNYFRQYIKDNYRFTKII